MRNLENMQKSQEQMPVRTRYFRLQQSGFSLIELMVVVAIIGVLASIAMPAYTDYVKKGRAVEATTALADARVKMEQYFQDNRTYVGGPCPAAGKYFTYACVVAATTFSISAAGTGDMSSFAFSVNQSNAKTSTFDGTSGATCWLTSKSGSC